MALDARDHLNREGYRDAALCTVDYRELSPLTWLVPLSKPSLGLNVVSLGLILVPDASRMLAIVFELSPLGCQPSFKNFPPGGTS